MTDRIDWATTDHCPRCWEHGPYLPGGVLYDDEAARAAHQAWHGFAAAWLGPVARWLRTDERGEG